jgi:beta-lactamase regulating signal transducer with metallopeptidase domain
MPWLPAMWAGERRAVLSEPAPQVETPLASAVPDARPNSTAAAPVIDTATPSRQPWTLLRTVLFIWLGGSLATLLWMWRGWRVAGRIVRDSERVTDAAWTDLLYTTADRLGLPDAPQLVHSAAVRMPFACGLRTATIVLPAASAAWTPERRQAVLLHELAHVQRFDLSGHLCAALTCAVYWFHPLVWYAARALRSESEQACDDLAVAAGTPAADYAEHLLDIVTSVKRDTTPRLAIAMARRREFEGRMLAILDPDRTRARVSRQQAAAFGISVGALTLLLGMAAPASMASADAREFAMQTRDTLKRSDTTRVRRTLPESVRTGEFESLWDSRDEPRPLPPGARTGVALDTNTDRDADPDSIDTPEDLRDTFRRRGAASASPERMALLVKLLRADSSAEVRRIAAWGLHEYVGTADAVREVLAHAVRTDSDGRVREMAAWTIGESGIGVDELASALAQALRGDRDARVRATAAWALGSVEPFSQREAVVAALRDADTRVRMRAAWAIGSAGAGAAPAALAELLSDADRQTQLAALWAIKESGDRRAIPALRAALSRAAAAVDSVRVLKVLAAFGEQSAPEIERMLSSGDARVRESAIRLLAQRGSSIDPWPWPWPDPRPMP